MDDEQVVIKITAMDERMVGMQKDIKVLFKRMDDRDARAATQNFTLIITCVGVILNLIMQLIRG